MTEYNCYSYAIELGFTEEEAETLQASKLGKGQDATVLRRLAIVKGLASMKPKYPMPPAIEPVPAVTSTGREPPTKKKRTIRRKSTAKK